MQTEIYIEGQQIDLSADISALFTYAIDDVKDFASRQTKFSKTIALPGSARNNQIFGHAFQFTAYNAHDADLPNVGANFNAAKAAACIVLVHGIQVFKGVIRLLEVKLLGGALEYETAVFGELGGLLGDIGNRKLTGNTDTAGFINTNDDLDFSAYDQAWSFTNMINSWAALAGGSGGIGVYFPLIDYGETTDATRVHFKYHALRPALYVAEYVQKIFAKAGYTYDCAFFQTAFFKRLIIPHNEDQLYKMVRMLVDHRRVPSGTALLESAGPTMSATPVFGTSTELNNFTVGGGGSSFTYIGATTPGAVTVALGFRCTGGQGLVRVTSTLVKNGTPITSHQFVMSAVGPTFTTHHTMTLQIPGGMITTGDVFNVACVATIPGIAPTSAWSAFLDSGRITIESLYAVAAPATYGDDLSINNLIPKGILQRDFLMSLVKMFNLCIVEDVQIRKHLRIMPYADFFDNSTPLDWTEKVDRSQEISLKPMAEVNARYFNFLYEKDSDYDNDTYQKRYAMGYGDRTFDAALDFVAEKKDLKVIFAATPLVGLSGNDKAVPRIMKLDSSGVESRTESKIRILQAKRIAVNSWDVLDDVGVTINSSTWYGYAGHVDDPGTPQGADLNFGAPAEIYWVPANPYTAPNLFNAFYSAYMAEITDKDSKLLTCFVKLSPIEVLNLDFSKAVLIDGQLWRLNKVVDFDAVDERPTKVELLKVINLSY